MLGLTFASLRARPLRALLTALSIVLGVAMISGTFVLTGQINRAFSEIFDAANVKNDVVVELRTVDENSAESFPEPFPASVLDPGREGAGRRRGARARSTPWARSSSTRTACPRASARPAGLPPLVFSASPARFDPGTFVSGRIARAPAARSPCSRTRPTRPARRSARRSASSRSTASSACASSGIYKVGNAASFGGALVSSIPLERRAALVRLRGEVHAGQPAGRARRLPRRSCATASAARSAAASPCRPGPRRRRPTRRASPT